LSNVTILVFSAMLISCGKEALNDCPAEEWVPKYMISKVI